MRNMERFVKLDASYGPNDVDTLTCPVNTREEREAARKAMRNLDVAYAEVVDRRGNGYGFLFADEPTYAD
jgi:hypothetical protein